MDIKINHLICRIKYLSGRKINKLFQMNNINEINSEQEKILYFLKNNEKLSTKQLSKLTGLAINSLTIMLDKMEKERIILRKLCPNDRRKKYIFLTEKFYKLKNNIEKTYLLFDDILLNNFNENEKKELKKYLERIIFNLENLEND